MRDELTVSQEAILRIGVRLTNLICRSAATGCMVCLMHGVKDPDCASLEFEEVFSTRLSKDHITTQILKVSKGGKHALHLFFEGIVSNYPLKTSTFSTN